MKIVFMGTPDFSVGALRALIDAGNEVSLVLTGEDKKRNRGEITMTPVKEAALEYGIEVLTPKSLRSEEIKTRLYEEEADVFVVVAYGKILPKQILDIPKFGCINIHASLLPAYRGAAPIQWAVIDGCKESGITTMLMDEGLDTGDILEQFSIYLDKKETGGSLFDKLSELGAKAIVSTLSRLGEIKRTKQGEMTTDYAKMIDKSMGNIDFSIDAVKIERLIRGLNPWPSAFTYFEGKMLKIWDADVSCVRPEFDIDDEKNFGRVFSLGSKLFVVCCRSVLEINELQLEGKKRMSASSFLMGRKITKESRFSNIR